MSRALASASLGLDEIGYINAHGSGTVLNDLVEAMALAAVGARGIPVSSTKGGTGHCLGAAGALEAVLCLEALERRLCPPSVRLEQALPEQDLSWVRAGGAPLLRPAALSNSFGFGGSCTTLIFAGGEE
jgi:3-oxoacyl-(acyl-carrier-protein) synthase